MTYVVLDTETTGLPDWSAPADAPSQPRLASYCLLKLDDDFEIEARTYGLVKPDGWEMPAGATAINGLTQERLATEGISIVHVLEVVRRYIDEGCTLVAHNLQFDAKIIRGELRRALMPDNNCRGGICTMRSLINQCAIPHPTRAGYKFPRLEEACRLLLQRNIHGAHDALADAKACLWLLRFMKQSNLLLSKVA